MTMEYSYDAKRPLPKPGEIVWFHPKGTPERWPAVVLTADSAGKSRSLTVTGLPTGRVFEAVREIGDPWFKTNQNSLTYNGCFERFDTVTEQELKAEIAELREMVRDLRGLVIDARASKAAKAEKAAV